NIITKSRQDYSQFVSLDGQFITQYASAVEGTYQRLEISGNLQDLGFYAGGSFMNNGAVHAGQGVLFPAFSTGYDQTAGDIRLDWQLGGGWSLTLVHQHLLQNDVPRTDRFALEAVNPRRFENRPTFADQERDFTYARLNWLGDECSLISGMQITAATQRRLERETELRIAERNAAGALVNQRTRLRDVSEEVNGFIMDMRAWTNFGSGHTLSYGAFFSYEDTDSSRLQIQAAQPLEPLIGYPATVISPTLPPDGRYQQFGVYLMDQLDVTDFWSISGGVRYSSIRAQGTARLFNTGAGALPPIPFDVSFDDWSAEFGSVV
ncbi:MAG TPA: TonB-dependent receptor, partial [Gemmatales bacterium]|nr:TonB-dependent receptor [Gemmatales bacterium]